MSTLDRFHLMNVYVAVADAESFTGAARKLNMSPPAVTRAVAALEQRLGIKLLNRTTRYVRMTDAGQRYFEDSRRLLSEIEEADEAAAGINAAPRGHLTITAPTLFGRQFVTPCVIDYLNQYPHVTASTIFLDRVVNLLEEGIDVGVRIGELADSSMRAIKVGYVRRIVCASPDYLAQHPAPKNLEELSNHTVIAATNASSNMDWLFEYEHQKKHIKIKPRLTMSTNDATIEAALTGFGIVRLLSYQAAPYIASGHLKVILTEYEPTQLPIHIVHRENRYASSKIRSFVDLLTKQLKHQQLKYDQQL